MSDPASSPQILDLSVYTTLDCERIEQAISDEFIELAENVAWVRAKEILNELGEGDVVLPVILADSISGQRGIMAWGVAKMITTESNQTHIRLEQVKAIAA